MGLMLRGRRTLGYAKASPARRMPYKSRSKPGPYCAADAPGICQGKPCPVHTGKANPSRPSCCMADAHRDMPKQALPGACRIRVDQSRASYCAARRDLPGQVARGKPCKSRFKPASCCAADAHRDLPGQVARHMPCKRRSKPGLVLHSRRAPESARASHRPAHTGKADPSRASCCTADAHRDLPGQALPGACRAKIAWLLASLRWTHRDISSIVSFLQWRCKGF